MTEQSETIESPQTDGQQIENALPAAVTTETPEQAKPNKNGYQPRVDLSGLPDDIREPLEERFAYMSRLIKSKETKAEARVRERDELLREQSRVIEELQSGMGKVVDHLHTKSIADEENTARQMLRDAHASGDTEAFITANDRLAEVKARKLAIANQPKAAAKEEKKQPNYRSAAEISQAGVDDGELDPVMGQTVKVWQSETDERGAPLRPWAQSRTPDAPLNDPLYRRAYLESAVVFDEDGPFAHMTVEQKLAEVDRRMGVQRNQGGQNVMGGGSLTTGRKSTKITLSPDAQKIALRHKFAGPGKSDADHLEAYRKQIEKVKGARS